MRKNILLLFLMICCSVTYAQIERTQNIVAISGQKYYMHKVNAKETMFSISKAYGVSISTLMEINDKTNTALQEGETLRIPYTDPSTVVQSPNYRHHLVKKGETLFSLSKMYGVSEKAIVMLNKGADKKIKEGQYLLIPEVTIQQPRFDSDYYYHIVKPKETMSVIARRYDMRLGKLKRTNRALRPYDLHPGDEVRIPIRYAKVEVAAIQSRNRRDAEQTEILFEKPTTIPEAEILIDESPVEAVEEIDSYEPEWKKRYEMVIFLPLKNSFVGMTNYYKGMLLAMEEKGEEKFALDVAVYESESSQTVVRKNMALHRKADFIIGPYGQNVFPAVLDFTNRKTTAISLLSKNTAVKNNKNVLQLNTTEETINKQIAKYIVTEHNANNVIVFNGTSYVKYADHTEDIHIKIEKLADLLTKTQDKTVYDYTKDYQQEFINLIDTERKNIVVVPETDRKVVGQILGALDVFNTNDLEVVGYYKWKLLPSLEPDLLYRLNVTYFTPFHFWASENKDFVTSYASRFQSYPDDFSYIGYETIRRLLQGLSDGGRYFYKQPMKNILRHKKGGYENTHLYKVQFKDDYTIDVK